MTDRLLRLMYARKLVLFGSAVLGMIAAAIFCILVDRIYSVEVVAVPAKTGDGDITGLGLGGVITGAGLLPGLLGSGNQGTKEALAILVSRSFLEDYIEEKDLLPILFHQDWHAKSQTWRDDNAKRTVWDGYEYFRNNVLSVSEDVNRGTYKVTIRWTDPNMAADWANELVSRVNKIVRTRDNEQARASVEFLRKELETTTILGVRESIFRLIESEVKKIMLTNTHPDYALRVIDPARTKPDDSYDYPKVGVLVPAGLFVGFFLCFSLLFVIEVFRSVDSESKPKSA